MRKKEYVEKPERPDIEQIVLLDRPNVTYINLSCTTKGVTMLIPKKPNDTKKQA